MDGGTESSSIAFVKVESESPTENSVGVSPGFAPRVSSVRRLPAQSNSKQVDGDFGRSKWNEREQLNCFRGEKK